MSSNAPAASSTSGGPPKLVSLALGALCRDWSPSLVLDGLSVDLAKLGVLLIVVCRVSEITSQVSDSKSIKSCLFLLGLRVD